MPGRLPTCDDFPSNVTLSITPPPQNHPATNILVLLHGLGDTHTPFTSLGQQLSLPETACISLRAPHELPLSLGGYHWGDDIVMDSGTGGIDADAGFERATRVVLEDVIRRGLMHKCGYAARDIVIFGYAQGGMVGIKAASEMDQEDELGGIVTVGGVGSLSLGERKKKQKTPILVCKAARASSVTEGALARLKDVFGYVEVREWAGKKNGDGMPSCREEMLPIMQFFARRLRSRRGVPEGSVELC